MHGSQTTIKSKCLSVDVWNSLRDNIKLNYYL